MAGHRGPKQEKWIDAHKAQMPRVDLWMALGATIDFEAGNVKRAPKWVQAIAMEWFYRFLMEPRRMFKRYFVDDVRFFWYLVQQMFGTYKNPFERYITAEKLQISTSVSGRVLADVFAMLNSMGYICRRKVLFLWTALLTRS